MPENCPIIVVTGLPRSGTSLMMQILKAGGVAVVADAHRSADASNPHGYFEFEKVKWLAADNSWLHEARGKAIKVIVQLAPFLPRVYSYRFIFMRRQLSEILSSQAAMLGASGQTPGTDAALLEAVFARNYASARDFAAQLPQSQSIEMGFADLISAPEAGVDRVIQFLDRPNLDRGAMAAAVDPLLYRSRA